MSSTLQEIRIPAPELRGAALELGSCHDMEVGLDGPAGCVAGETRIYNPVTGEHVPIRELYEKGIAPIVQTLMGAIQAEVPFRKGVRDLYRVTLASGRQCIVTENHIFLTSNGWGFLSSCAPGSHLLISSPCPYPSTEALGPLVSLQDALRLSQTPLGFQDGCPAFPQARGVRPLMEASNVLVAAPSQDDALLHNRVGLHTDDQETSRGYNHLHQQSDRHARSSYPPAYTDMACTLSRTQQGTSSQVDALYRYDAQSLREKRLLLPIVQLQLDGDNMRHHALLLEEYQPSQEDLLRDVWANSIPQQLAPCFSFSDMTQEYAGFLPESRACSLSNVTSNTVLPYHSYDYTIHEDTVSSIEYVRTDEYFDLHVPIAEHYLAEGIWHHNTGKTFGILYYIHVLLLKYPGAKWLTTRRYNTDLAGSAMATYQNDVLDPHEGVYYFGGNKVKPPGFIYPNGSFMAVNGLDRPGRLKSFECDGVYINEATECEIDHIEYARMRLRKGVMPWQQIVMDFNPDAPGHFLNERMNAGITTRLLSRHEDNPRYYDVIKQEWTEQGQKYIFETLGGLTGVRLARYRYGIWAAAEGTVYEDSWDRARNVIDRFPIPKEWPRYMVVDFGYTNPFVCQWFAVDPDGRLYRYREIYKTKTLVEDHAVTIAERSGWFHLLPRDHAKHADRPADWADPLPREIICDHDAEDRATLERHLRLFTTPAKKSISDGIQAVAARLRAAGDGKPRLYFLRDSLVERDHELARMKKPTCFEEEVESYVWRQGTTGIKEEPVDMDNHAQDSTRYMCAHLDLMDSGVSYFKNIWA